MTYPAWTPASRPGIIPLHPLTFGTILGRAFTALRQNPRVLLGFALGVQVIAYLVLMTVVGLVTWATFSRLDTVSPGSDEYDTLMAGSIATSVIVAFVLGLTVGALSAIVQGVVVADVAHAAVAEKLTLRALWRQFTPVAWRLVGFSLMIVFATLMVFTLAGLGIVALGVVALPAAIGLGILLVLLTIPIYLWLAVKLLLVPSVIVLERARIFPAIARSWALTRGRFWPALGVMVVIVLAFGVLAQVVSIPFSLAAMGFTTIISPTGEPDAESMIGFLIGSLATQMLTLIVQAIALVVESTAAALIYIDCRMRHEGLDLDLLQYVEQRDAGVSDLPDPYLAGIGRELPPRPAYAYPPGYPAPGGVAPPYGAPQYGPPPGYAPGGSAPGYPPPGYAPAAPPPGGSAPGAAGAPGMPPQAYTPPSGEAPRQPAERERPESGAPERERPEPGRPGTTPPGDDETRWAAPGAPRDDRDQPWR